MLATGLRYLVTSPLSSATKYSAIRQAGNSVAHDATQDDIRQAVLQQPEGTGRSNLMRVFKFVYGVDV